MPRCMVAMYGIIPICRVNCSKDVNKLNEKNPAFVGRRKSWNPCDIPKSSTSTKVIQRENRPENTKPINHRKTSLSTNNSHHPILPNPPNNHHPGWTAFRRKMQMIVFELQWNSLHQRIHHIVNLLVPNNQSFVIPHSCHGLSDNEGFFFTNTTDITN